jgi:hypothetical protein
MTTLNQTHVAQGGPAARLQVTSSGSDAEEMRMLNGGQKRKGTRETTSGIGEESKRETRRIETKRKG